MDENQKETHESYGMLRIGRLSGHDTHLFGSSIPHRNTICLAINPGVVERSINHDHYYAGREPYIEVEMSQSQFAEAITSMNMGPGVPVTIRQRNGENIEEPNFTNKRMQFEQEFKTRMQNLQNRLERLTENAEDVLANKKSITKSDRQTILGELNALKIELTSNIPYVAKSFNEQMDQTSKEAKAEVEAFTINKVNQLGLEKLHEQNELPVSETPLQQLTKHLDQKDRSDNHEKA